MDVKKLYDTEMLIHKLKSLIEAAPNAFGIGAVKDTLEGARLYRDKTLAELTKKYAGKPCIVHSSKWVDNPVNHVAKIEFARGCNTEGDVIMKVVYTDHVGWDYKLLSQLTLQE